MFRWNEDIYMDETVKKRPYKYRNMIERHTKRKSCYCITMPQNDKNCMDVYSSKRLISPYDVRPEIEIIGLAADKDSAIELVRQILTDIYVEYGTVDAGKVRAFFDHT